MIPALKLLDYDKDDFNDDDANDDDTDSNNNDIMGNDFNKNNIITYSLSKFIFWRPFLFFILALDKPPNQDLRPHTLRLN